MKSPITGNHQPPVLLIGLGNPGKEYAGNRHNIGFMAVDLIAQDYGFSKPSKKFGGSISEGFIPPPIGGRLGGGHSCSADKLLTPEQASPHPNPPPAGEGKVYIFKPLGYMNTSGGPGSEAANFYKIPLEKIIVIHDELDLPLGKLRVKRGGGNGGHNGLKSLDAHLGKDYWRVRLGIGHPGDKDMVSDYVLGDFAKAERPELELMLNEVSKHIGVLLDGDEAKFMSKIALATKE